MKAYRIPSLIVLLTILLFPAIQIQTQPVASAENTTGLNRPAADETLLLQLYVDKGAYNTGDNVLFSGLLSFNGYPIVGAQICLQLRTDSGDELWGACMLTNNEGRFSETLTYGYAIPQGYSGYLIVSASAYYDEVDADQEMRFAYGLGSDDDDEEGELTISLYPYDKPEFAMGDSPTIGGDVLVGGQPLANAQVCTEVWGDAQEYMYGACHYTDANGQFSFWLEYGVNIPTGYRGNLVVEGNVAYEGAVAAQVIYVPYGNEALDLPLALELWGPLVPIQIGGWEVLQFGGTVTSQGVNVDGATVTMVVSGGTYQTTTGMTESGKFYYGWENDTFTAGEYVVQVTVSKPGYQSASGTIPFTVFGEGYDFVVVMDPIQPVYAPSTNVPFPGTLTLGGTPVSDWIETDVTYPDGTVETFINQTEADGRFIRILPSIMKPGTYQLVVYYSGDRKQISPVYTFSVGEAKSTQTPGGNEPPEDRLEWRIINVSPPQVVTLGDTIEVTGTLVMGEGENQVPLPDIPIQLGVRYGPSSATFESWDAVSQDDGSFSFSVTLTSVNANELIISAFTDDDKVGAVYYNYLEVLMPVSVQVNVDDTTYQTGEKVTGTVEILPKLDTSSWYPSFDVLIQFIGPTGANEETYIFGSASYQSGDSGFVQYAGKYIDFWWVVPDGTEAGNYRVEVIVTGGEIFPAQGEASFSLGQAANSVNFKADFSSDAPGYDVYTTQRDPFYPGRVFGKYTDHQNIGIDNAEVRIIAVNTGQRAQKVELNTTTDQAGEFNLTLEKLNCLGGGKEIWWELTVYADKEGYSTGADVVFVSTPVANPRIEIIQADPLANDLQLQAYNGGINFTQAKPYTIKLLVKYTACEAGTVLWVTTKGDWALKPNKVVKADNGYISCDNSTFKAAVSINGSSGKPLGIQDLVGWDKTKQETMIPLEQGIGKEIAVTLVGELFNYKQVQAPYTDPLACGINLPLGQSPTLLRLGGVSIWMALDGPIDKSLCDSLFCSTGIEYEIKNTGNWGYMRADGSAWVSQANGNAQATVKHGAYDSTNARLSNHTVQLQAMIHVENFVNPDPKHEVTLDDFYESTDLIKVAPSVQTDQDGHFSTPLTFEGNPCDYIDLRFGFPHFKDHGYRFKIKVSADGFNGPDNQDRYISVDLRCTPKIAFSFTNQSVYVFQAADLSENSPIILADRKPTGVRVELEAAGEIDREATVGINMRVNIGGKEFTQHGILQFGGAKQHGAIYFRNLDGTTVKAKVTKLLDSVALISVDFLFTPEINAKTAPIEIEITLDKDKAYGETISVTKKGEIKKMRGIRFVFVPIGDVNLNLKWVLKQVNFVKETYPVDAKRVRVGFHPGYPYEWARTLIETAVSLQLSVTNTATGTEEFRVIGVVDPALWDSSGFGAETATGAHFAIANNVLLLKHSEISEHVLAHELGHSFGLNLTSLLQKITFKSEEQYDLLGGAGRQIHGLMIKNGKPYDIPKSWIEAEFTDWVAAFGKDPASTTAWLIKSAKTKNGAQPPITVYDIMGSAEGAQRSWIDKETYAFLLGAMADPPDSQVIKVQGLVNENGSIQLGPVWVMDGLPDTANQERAALDGEFDLQLQSGSGEVLSSTKFGALGISFPFSFSLPVKPGTARVVLSRQGEVLVEVTRSAVAPTVQFTQAPVLHENGMLDLWWGSSDSDGDTLIYGIQYRCSGAESWLPIEFGLEQQTYSLDTSWLAGGSSCTARVQATDGFNTTSAVSQPFSVPQKPPSTSIVTELTSADPIVNPVRLEGIAYDPEGGLLSPDQLTWSSDLDGDLGSGSYLEVALSPGEHTITLTGLDSSGMTAEDSIRLTVAVSETSEPLIGLQSLWIIGFLILVFTLGLGAVLILWLVLRNRGKPQPAAIHTGDQYQRVPDPQDRLLYQDQNNGRGNFLNGQASQPIPGTAPNIAAPQLVPAKKQRVWGWSCLLSLLISGVIGLIVVGGISLVAFNFFPGYMIEVGQGDLTQILKLGGGGLLMTILGLLLLNGGFKAIITRRAIVEDEQGRQREKRGCWAILNGLGQLIFGAVCLVGGLGLMTQAFYQEILPWLGF